MEVDAAAPLPEPPVLKRHSESEKEEDGSPASKKSVHARPPCSDAMPLRGSRKPRPGWASGIGQRLMLCCAG